MTPNGDLGTVISDVQTARAGDKVTLTAKNNPGCALSQLKVVAGYPVTSGGGGAHAPANKAASFWYQQQEIETTKVNDSIYEFTLPEKFSDVLTPNYQPDTEFKVFSEFKSVSPMVVWSDEEKTLYFIYEEDPALDYAIGDKWNDVTISKLWTGSTITDTGWGTPGWASDDAVKTNAEKVVFNAGFAEVRPKSCFQWFARFPKINTIEGLEYLNTSEVTNMNSMFFYCAALTHAQFQKLRRSQGDQCHIDVPSMRESQDNLLRQHLEHSHLAQYVYILLQTGGSGCL